MQEWQRYAERYLESALPVRELEEGFDDWVRDLRAILQAQEDPLLMSYTEQKSGEGGNAGSHGQVLWFASPR